MTRRTLTALLFGGAALISSALTLLSCSSGGRLAEEGAALLARTGSGTVPPWSMFGKNSLHTRLSEHTGPPTNRLKWKSNTTSDVYLSSPAIAADGTVYIGDQGSATSPPMLYAFSSSGVLKWTYATIGAVDSPAISADGGTVYIGGGFDYQAWPRRDPLDHKVYAINTATHVPDWTYTTGGAIESAAVVGADGTVYVGSRDGNLYALNPDGTLKWSFTAGIIDRCSPAIGSDGTLYIGTCIHPDDTYSSGKLFAVNPDGTEKWEYLVGGFVISSPAIAPPGTLGAGTVYIGSADQIDNTDNALYAFNPDGTLKWRYATDQRVYSSPAVGADGTVYVGSWGNNSPEVPGRLYAINPDGTLRWSYGAGTNGHGVYSSPALGADGTVYFADYYGIFSAVNSSGTLKWSYPMGTRSASSPAIGADGTVYMGHDAGPDIKVKGKWVPQPAGLFAFGPGIN